MEPKDLRLSSFRDEDICIAGINEALFFALFAARLKSCPFKTALCSKIARPNR